MPFTSPRPEQKYSCKQEELYQVCLLGWDSYLENVSDFTSANTTYTLVFGETSRTAVLTAKAMPDFQARDEAGESLLILMKEDAVQCLIQWNFLETHIKKSFPVNLHKPKLEAAGSEHYLKALRNNWESVSALMESGKKFITQNMATLTAGGMPAGFPATFNTTRSSFETFYTQFKDAQQDAEELRDDKINANNAIFRLLSSMFEDGQKIYRNNPAKRERFIFSKVLELVTSTPPAPAPLLLFLTLTTNQNPPLPQVSMGIKGTSGDKASILWGDGLEDEITLSGVYVNTAHTYFIPDLYTILQKGKPENITGLVGASFSRYESILLSPLLVNLVELNFSGSGFSAVSIPTELSKLSILFLAGNNLDAASVEQILITMNDFNTNNGTINVSGGTNATPTAQGITAKNALISRGWTVVTN